MSQKKRTQRTMKKLSDARAHRLRTRKAILQHLMIVKTQVIAASVARKVQKEIKDAVQKELDARGYLPRAGDREDSSPSSSMPQEPDGQLDPPTSNPLEAATICPKCGEDKDCVCPTCTK